MAKRKYKHSKIIDEISNKLDIDRKLVHLIIRKFYSALRSLMKRNEEINVPGLFIIKLEKSYKNRIKKEGKNINLRKRKDQKYDYVKKSSKK